MAKAGELDWSHLEKHGHIERCEHPLSAPLNLKKSAKGIDVVNQFSELANSIIRDTPPQPTNEQMFGHLVPSEEQVRKAEHEWENKISGFYEEATKPIEPQVETEWGNCKSFKDTLTEEELKKYIEEEKKFDKQLR